MHMIPPMQTLQPSFTHEDPDIYRMRDKHRPSLDSISEDNDDNNNKSSKVYTSHPLITVTGCDVSNFSDEDYNGNDLPTIPIIPLTGSETDLSRLKTTATRLRLGTRRPSYIEWREKYVERPRRRSKPDFTSDADDISNGNNEFTEERKTRINEALEWLRTELNEMRSQDQVLARTLLTLRHDIAQLKLKRSCEAHKELIEDVKSDMEELHVLRDISDSPSDSLENPFKHLGVTPMNISSRRFSIF